MSFHIGMLKAKFPFKEATPLGFRQMLWRCCYKQATPTGVQAGARKRVCYSA
jgi:hypothetical protein